jgi:hypothetical protein
MMNKLTADLVFPREGRHLQRVERQSGAQVVSNLPARSLWTISTSAAII